MKNQLDGRIPVGGFGGYQHELEARALEFLKNPAIRDAQNRGAELLRTSLPSVDATSLELLPTSAEEITFLALFNALNHDCNDPQIEYVETLPYVHQGQPIPGSRGLDDNPDTVYRIVPVDSSSVYEFSGRVYGGGPIVNDFSLLSKDWHTLDHLDKARLVTDADGRFEISLSPEAPGGRSNHIKTGPGADYLMIRDTLADWKSQRANDLAVQKVDGPATERKNAAELLQSAIGYVDRWFKETVRLHTIGLKYAANDLMQPQIRSDHGMLVTQAYSVGHFDVAEDAALLITMHPGGARYLTVPITNLWGLSVDPERCTSSLNNFQSEQNPDGTYTYVLSRRDPGIHNWIDTNGLSRGFLFLRWAAIEPTGKPHDKPAVESRLVRFDQLSAALPSTVKYVDREYRIRQLEERARAYNNRFQ